MTKEEMIEAIKAIKSPVKEITTIYKVLDELGITYQKTKCGKCRRDLFNICREELGLIDNAAEQSDFNGTDTYYEWKYLKRNGTRWNGKIYNQNTDPKMIEAFVKVFPTGFYEKIAKPQQEETINNTELNTNENGN